MDGSVRRAAISLAPIERERLLKLVPLAPCGDSDCATDATVSSARDRLEGKSLATTAGTNFGRDKHEAALGSTVTSVQLSIAEVDLLRARLAASELPLRDSLGAKLELLREALAPQSPLLVLKALAACEPPSIVPVTVLTGCLGAGKTTVIRSLLRGLPAGYTCAWLKNEYGDAGVDSMVARDDRVAVKEIVNGCLCCTRVGELADALKALHELSPHRILVEASGSAMPGPLVWEIEKVSEIVRVDGVVTVVDCANFARITNFSRTAKLQAKCTDLLLLNKVELAGEEMIERVLDDLHELVPDAPKVRTVGSTAVVDPAIVFGLDAALWRSSRGEGEGEGGGGGGVLRAATADEATHMDAEAECHHVLPRGVPPGWSTSRAALEALLKVAPPDELYRTKGIVPFSLVEAEAEAARQGLPAPTAALRTQLGDTWWLFNGVAGRLTLEPLAQVR
jgi:G3E family GTPase